MKTSIKCLLILTLIWTVAPNLVPYSYGSGRDDAEKQITFADSLFSEGDYYRAISEYKRFIHYFKDDPKADYSSFRIAECYFKAKRWADAVQAVKMFLDHYPQSALTVRAMWIKAVSEKNQKKYKDAISTFHDIAHRDSGELKDRAYFEIALIYVDQEDWGRASDSLSNIPSQSGIYAHASQFRSGLAKIDDLPQKSPATAGTLAALLPGAGHAYTERYRDALVAFLLNASFITAAVELFRHDNNVAGGIVTFFEVGWYTGNIYSAVSSAHKYNRRVKEEFINKLKEQDALSFNFDHENRAGMVMYNMTF